MCRAEEQMKQIAFAEGEKRGEKRGLAMGKILGTVTVLKEMQFTVEQIQEKLMKIYALSADEALRYITG